MRVVAGNEIGLVIRPGKAWLCLKGVHEGVEQRRAGTRCFLRGIPLAVWGGQTVWEHSQKREDSWWVVWPRWRLWHDGKWVDPGKF